MRSDRWATSVVTLASAVLLMLGAGVVSATTVDPRAGDDGRARAAGDYLGALGADATTTTSAGVAPVPSTIAPLGTTPSSRPSTTSSTPGAPRPTTTVAANPVATSPERLDPWPADVDRRYQPERKTWSTAAGGWTIKVTVDDPTPTVGQPIGFDIELSSSVEPCCAVTVLFDSAPTFRARAGDPCPEAPERPGSVRFHTTVAFERPGWQSFNLTANTGRCGLDPPRASVIGDIEVAPRPLNTQGPRPPVVLLEPAAVPGHPGDRNWLAMGGNVSDPDGGRIRSVTVSWGDGSPVSHPGQPLPPACTVEADGSTHSEALSFGGVAHHYATPGSYAVTVTAVSTACDGVSMPQTSSERLTWSTESGLGTPFG